MRYKLARPKDLPDDASLFFLEVQVDIYRKIWRLGSEDFALVRNEALKAILALGTAYHFRGDDENAITVLEELVANQDKITGLNYLAVSYERLHRYEKAIATHREALRRAPTSIFHLGHLGRLLSLMGREKEALDVLKVGHKAAPYDAHIRSRLASIRSRLNPSEFGEASRQANYTFVVVLGDRSNFSIYQSMLESLYARKHKIILVVDADDTDKVAELNDEGRLELKAWVRRHPGIEVNDHATVHRRRLDSISRLLRTPYAGTENRCWMVSVSRELGGWIRKVAADLVLVCLDRTDPMFAEPYVRAAEDAGNMVCALGGSTDPTALERRLNRSIPVIRCMADNVTRSSPVVSFDSGALVVSGDLKLEPTYRPEPGKSEHRVFDQIFPTLAAGPFLLYLADQSRPPLDELRLAATLATRLRGSNRLALRRMSVVYRSARPAKLPVQFAKPANLILWPRPDASQDSNTATALRVGLHRAEAVISGSMKNLRSAVMANRPAIVLRSDGSMAECKSFEHSTGAYQCEMLGEVVGLVGEIQDGQDPLAGTRRALLAAADLSSQSRFSTLGGLLGQAAEFLAAGESIERATKLLRSDFHDALLGDLVLTGEGTPLLENEDTWFDVADRALEAAGSELRVAQEFRTSTTIPVSQSLAPALDAAAALVSVLEQSGLVATVIGDGATPLSAQLLGGFEFPEDQLQAALLLKAVFPHLTIYLVDVVDRFERTEQAVRAVFPEARVANVTGGSPGKLVRSNDFLYTLDKRLSDHKTFAPSFVIAESALSLVTEERALVLANRLAEWSVPFLVLSIVADHPRAVRYAHLNAVLRRSFRLTDLGDGASGRYLTSLAVSRETVTNALAGRSPIWGWPKALGSVSVTIALVVYNGSSTIGEAIESILAQTYWDFEVIVVDNGSTDATLSIVRRYAEHDSRISVYPRPKNIGAIGNFRFALSLSRGRYFCWASDHDLYDAVWLERLVRSMDGRPNAVLAYPFFGMIDDRGNRLGDHLVRFDTSGRRTAQRLWLVADLMRGSGSKVYGLYRREALDRVRIRTTVWWDRLFLLELATIGEFVQVNEVLWWRRYKGVLRDKVAAPEAGKFGLIPTPLSTKDTVIRQLAISFEDGRPPFLMRMATLANAVLMVWDTAIAPPGRRGPDLRMLPVAVRVAYRAVVRTKAFLPAEFSALRDYLLRGR